MPRRMLAGKRAIITGVSSGLGFHLAQQFAQQKMRLVINARRLDRLREVENQILDAGGQCVVVDGDICDAAVQQSLIQNGLDQFGGVDILVNNAGVGAMGAFAAADPDRLRKIFEVNFFSMASLISKCLPHLQNGDDPLIVNVGSVLGHRAAPLKVEYCASKFAIHGFSDALRAELSNGPVELLLVSPSQIDTDFFEAAIEDTSGKSWKSKLAMSPEYVAAKTIQAMQKRKHEIILPLSGKFLVWFDRWFPNWANHAVARFGQ